MYIHINTHTYTYIHIHIDLHKTQRAVGYSKKKIIQLKS